MSATPPRQPARPRRHPLAIATTLLLGGAPFPVLAQDDSRAEALDQVVVTATRREETLQEVPINITAVTGADIEQRGLKDLADLVRTVPGLHLVDQGGRDTNLLVVRGLNVSTLTGFDGNLSGGGVVAQYIGDIPLYLDFRLLDIDRVEALLGPQGTLYGAGTLGGAIRYLPNRPEPGETSIETAFGLNTLSHSSDIGGEARVIANLPIGENGAFRAAVGYYEDPGFIDYDYVLREPGVSNPQPDFSDPADVAANLRQVADANDNDVLSGRFGLRYDFTDALTANLTWFYQRQQAGGRTINHRQSFNTGRYVSAQRYLEPNDRESQLLSLEIEADLGFATLTSATGVSRYEDDGQRDQTDLLLNFEYGYETFPSFSSYTHELTDQDRFNQELRLVSSGDGPFSWIVGAFYNRADTYGTSSEFVPGLPAFWEVDRPDALEYYSVADTRFEEQALFGEIGYRFTEAWSVTLGARRFEFEDDTTSGFDLPFLNTLLGDYGPDEINPALEQANVSDSDTIFKFNTAYQFNNEVLGYLTLSEGYRTGGSNVIPACDVPLSPGQNVCALPNELLIQPDKTLNHEIGLKTTWLDGRVTLNSALYLIEWEDIQVAGTTVNGNLPITVNAGQAESRGVELSGAWRIGNGLSLTAGYSYTDAQLTEDAPGLVSGEDAFDGDRLPGSPEHQANLGVNWYQTLPGGLGLGLDYNVYGQSDVYTRVGLRNAGEALPGYATHDAAVTLFGEAWTLQFYVKNLFDRYAWTGVRSSPEFVRDVNGFALRSYYKSVLEPMRVGINLSYRF